MMTKTDKFTFGKHKGNTLEQVANRDPAYIVWAHKTVDWFDCSAKLVEQCQDSVDEADAVFEAARQDRIAFNKLSFWERREIKRRERISTLADAVQYGGYSGGRQ